MHDLDKYSHVENDETNSLLPIDLEARIEMICKEQVYALLRILETVERGLLFAVDCTDLISHMYIRFVKSA